MSRSAMHAAMQAGSCTGVCCPLLPCPLGTHLPTHRIPVRSGSKPGSSMTKQVSILNLLRVSRLPIYNQLVLEEALLRNTKQNWMILNDGAFQPAIVMGISGRPEELVDIPKALQLGIQLIKRFTGGGTVVVDQDTIFSSLIFQGESLPHVECYPRPIMKWTEDFYNHAFAGMHVQGHGFALRENDYVFGQHKFGGNAQAITGKRWLHHTSLLWNYEPDRMSALQQPKRAPEYRQGRQHHNFLVPLSRVQLHTHHQPHSRVDHEHGAQDKKEQHLKTANAQRHGSDSCSSRDPSSGPAHSSSDVDAARHYTSQSHSMQTDQMVDVEEFSNDQQFEGSLQHRNAFVERLIQTAHNLEGFEIQEQSIETASKALLRSSHCGTRILNLEEFLS